MSDSILISGDGRGCAKSFGTRSRRECVEGDLSIICHLSFVICQWKEYAPTALPLSMINE